MSYVLTDESNYEDIADAIREKLGTNTTYLPSQMAAAIRSIPSSVTLNAASDDTSENT